MNGKPTRRFIRSGPFHCALVAAVLISAVYGRVLYREAGTCLLQIAMRSTVDGTAKLYIDTGKGFSEQETATSAVTGGEKFRIHEFPLPRKKIDHLRYDPLEGSGVVAIRSVALVNGLGSSLFPIGIDRLRPANQIKSFDLKDDILNVVFEDQAGDPQIALTLDSPLSLDSFSSFPFFLFLGYLLGGFLIFLPAIWLLLRTLNRRGILVDFCDHPIKASIRWVEGNKLFFSMILSLAAFRVFFVLTYPLNTCSDAGTYYMLMQTGQSSLVHATGYPYLMHLLSGFLLTKTDLLVFQHAVDFGVQLALMVFLKSRFGLPAAVVAGICYGLEVRTINWVSQSSPEWLQGIFLALAFVLAVEAYFAKKAARKASFYLLSAWLFTWSVLVKFLTVVMLPAYLILMVLEKREGRGKGVWLCAGAMCLVFALQSASFIYLYHLPSTGTVALTHDVGWILNDKIRSFIPDGRGPAGSGPWMKRYRILISEMPGSSGDIDIHQLYRHMDSVPSSIRKPYQARYQELLAKGDLELQEILQTEGQGRDLEQNFLISDFYLGLRETDDLLKRVFLEAILRYPKDYIGDVLGGIKESFFLKTSYYIATVRNPGSSNPEHPFGLEMKDVVRHLPWGYALFNVSSDLRCMYEAPVFLKAGLLFFTAWGENFYIPTIVKWVVVLLALVVVTRGSLRDGELEPGLLYLSMGALVLVLLICLSNVIFIFRDKEFQASQHLFCLLTGIAVSCLIAYGRRAYSNRPEPAGPASGL